MKRLTSEAVVYKCVLCWPTLAVRINYFEANRWEAICGAPKKRQDVATEVTRDRRGLLVPPSTRAGSVGITRMGLVSAQVDCSFVRRMRSESVSHLSPRKWSRASTLGIASRHPEEQASSRSERCAVEPNALVWQLQTASRLNVTFETVQESAMGAIASFVEERRDRQQNTGVVWRRSVMCWKTSRSTVAARPGSSR